MAWLGSQRNFEARKEYLDRIINGEREFISDNPSSFARSLRGALKYVRECSDSRYEAIFLVRVVQTAHGVVIETDSNKFQSTRTFVGCRLYDILVHLGNPVPECTYLFRMTRLTEKDKKTIKEFCVNSGFNIVSMEGEQLEVTT